MRPLRANGGDAVNPYYEDAAVRLYHGDCRDVLPALSNSPIDLLLSDPPYGQQFAGRGLTTTHANIRADGARQGMRVVREMLFEIGDALSADAHAYLFCHWESWPDFYDAVSSYLPIKNALVWWKDRGGMGDTDMEYARDYEVILYAARPGRPLAGRRDGCVIDGIPPVGVDRRHPVEKPIALGSYLVQKSCPAGGLVCDPFCGSGPFLVAAKNLGRRAIGVEIEERWCEVAARRLSQEVLQFVVAPASST